MAPRKKAKTPAAQAAKRATPARAAKANSQAPSGRANSKAPSTRANSATRSTRANSATRATRANSAASETNRPPTNAGRGNSKTRKGPQATTNQATDLSILPEESEGQEGEENDLQKLFEERHASPTMSDGPEFEDVSAVSIEDSEAARRTLFSHRGFSNPQKFLCYRNSLVVVLLHSTRITQWLKHRYIQQIDATGLKRYSYLDGDSINDEGKHFLNDNSDEESISEMFYTDVLCELYYLSRVYRNHRRQHELNEAMDFFWEYLQKEHDEHEMNAGFPSWEFKGEQDSAALLRWIFQMARVQRLSLVDGLEAPMLPPGERQKLEPLRSLDIENIVGFKMTKRRNCVYCDRASHSKRRFSKLDEDNIWSFPVLIPVEGQKKHQTNVDLYDCMRRSLKSELDDATCEACRGKVKAVEDKFQGSMDRSKKRITSQKAQARDLDNIRAQRDEVLSKMKNYEGHIWNKIAKLPEVLFLSLTRILQGDERKQKVIVEIPQELDLRAVVEHRIPLPSETKYRIVGIVNHRGVISGGHYIAQTFTGNKWTEFNDKDVSRTDLKSIIGKQGLHQDKAFTPYLIMYEKIPLDESGEEGGEQEDAMKNNDQHGADRHGDGSPTIPIDALPICIQPSSTSVLQVAKSTEPGPNQGHISVAANINSTTITFPTYVIENHSNFDVNLGEIELCLTDSSLHSILLSAKQSNQLAIAESRKRTSEEVESDGGDIDNSSPGSKRQKSNSPASKQRNVSLSPGSKRQKSNSPASKQRNVSLSPGSKRQTLNSPGSNSRRTSLNANRSTPTHQSSNQQADGVTIRRSSPKSAQTPAKGQSPKPQDNPLEDSETITVIPGLGYAGTDAGQNGSNNNGDDEDSLFNGSPTGSNVEDNEQDKGGEEGDGDWEIVPKSIPTEVRSSPLTRREDNIPKYGLASSGGPTTAARASEPWGTLSDDDVERHNWGQPRLIGQDLRIPMARYFTDPPIDTVQAYLDRKRSRVSFESHGEADNESTSTSALSQFTSDGDGNGDGGGYWKNNGNDDHVSISDDEDDGGDDDFYGGSERGFVLGMGGAVAAVPKRWNGYV